MMASKNPPVESTFASRLREVRNLRKLTQVDLAVKSGLASTAISHFEIRTRLPSLSNLIRLADALDVSADYLLGRSNNSRTELIESVATVLGELDRIRPVFDAVGAQVKECEYTPEDGGTWTRIPSPTLMISTFNAYLMANARGDGFNCCGGNDTQPRHHCSDCSEHPWSDKPDPRCVDSSDQCPHKKETKL